MRGLPQNVHQSQDTRAETLRGALTASQRRTYRDFLPRAPDTLIGWQRLATRVVPMDASILLREAIGPSNGVEDKGER